MMNTKEKIWELLQTEGLLEELIKEIQRDANYIVTTNGCDSCGTWFEIDGKLLKEYIKNFFTSDKN